MPNDTTNTAPDGRAVLKPCPFCGGRAATDIPPQRRQVECLVCGAAVYNRAAWNTRTPPQVKPLVWRDAQVMGCEGKVSGPYEIYMSRWRYNGGLSYISSDPISSAQADYTRRILEALA